MNYLIDTSAWIEYLEGSAKGQTVNEIIKNKENQLYSIPVIIAEVISKIKRKKGNIETAFKVLSLSNILKIDIDCAKQAGILHAYEKEKNQSFSLVDAIIIKTAQKNSLKIITTDSHFKGYKETIFL